MAARRLKYANPNVHGSRMLANDSIRSEIDRRLAQKKLSANEVLARLSDMARSNIADFSDVQSASDLKRYRHKTHVIKKFKRKITRNLATGVEYEELELELYGADSALVNIGRHYKLFTDSIKVDDWRSQLLDLMKQGKLTKEQILDEFRDSPSLAEELFNSIGLSAVEAGQAEGQS